MGLGNASPSSMEAKSYRADHRPEPVFLRLYSIHAGYEDRSPCEIHGRGRERHELDPDQVVNCLCAILHTG